MADERKIEAIYIMLEDDIDFYGYDKEEIEFFHARRAKHLKEESSSYTTENSLNLIRAFKR